MLLFSVLLRLESFYVHVMVEFFGVLYCLSMPFDSLLSLKLQLLQLHLFPHQLLPNFLFFLLLLLSINVLLSLFDFVSLVMMFVSHVPVVPGFSYCLFVLFLLVLVYY